MYNEEKLTKLRALKQLAERIDRDFADGWTARRR